MFNKTKFVLVSIAGLFALSACGQNNLSPVNIQPVQPVITKQSEEAAKFYNTAKDRLWVASMEARRWDVSADLVKVEARIVDENGRGNWTYYFKSPFKRNAFRIENGMGREVPNSFFGSDFSEINWRIDSNKAIEIAKKSGLDRFPVIEMVLEERFVNLEWEMRTYNGTIRVDAERGTIAK